MLFHYRSLLLSEDKKAVDVLTIHLSPREKAFKGHEKDTAVEQEALIVLVKYCVQGKGMKRGTWSSHDLVDC